MGSSGATPGRRQGYFFVLIFIIITIFVIVIISVIIRYIIIIIIILGLVAGAGYLQFHRKKKEDEQAMEGRFPMIMINMIIKIMIMIDSFKKFAFCVF